MFGREPNLALHRNFDLELQPDVARHRQMIKGRRAEAIERLREAREACNAHMDRTARPITFSVGDIVLKRHPVSTRGAHPYKLLPRFIGPFRVLWDKGVTVGLEWLDKPQTARLDNFKCHKDLLRKCSGEEINRCRSQGALAEADEIPEDDANLGFDPAWAAGSQEFMSPNRNF